MKKIFSIFIISILLLMSVDSKAIVLEPSNEATNSIKLVDTTEEIVINVDPNKYDVKYDTTKLSWVEDSTKIKLFVLTPTLTKIAFYERDTAKLSRSLTLDFVHLETLEIRYSEDSFYVYSDDERIFGDFTWEYNDETIVGSKLTAPKDADVRLIYDNNTYTLTKPLSKTAEYITLILGLPLLLFIIIYVINLLLPVNPYKKINKQAINLKRYIAKHTANTYDEKSYTIIYVQLRLRLSQMVNYSRSIPNNNYNDAALLVVLSKLEKLRDTLIKLNSHYPLEEINGLLNYININLDTVISESKGKHLVKEDRQKNKKIKIIKDETPLSKSEEDALRYLEGLNIIDKQK